MNVNAGKTQKKNLLKKRKRIASVNLDVYNRDS